MFETGRVGEVSFAVIEARRTHLGDGVLLRRGRARVALAGGAEDGTLKRRQGARVDVVSQLQDSMMTFTRLVDNCNPVAQGNFVLVHSKRRWLELTRQPPALAHFDIPELNIVPSG